MSPEGAIVGIMQDIILVSRAQLLNGEIVEVITNENFVKHIGDFEGIMKASFFTVVNKSLISWGVLLIALTKVPKGVIDL